MKRTPIIIPPFPKLTRDDFGELNGSDLFNWKGVVRLESWSGFASHEELSGTGWSPKRGRLPDGDFALTVDPVMLRKDARPTAEQAKAFEILMRRQAKLRDSLLASLFEIYPTWRKNYLGSRVSSDGGKTWQRGWDLPNMFPPANMPDVGSRKELMRLVRPSSVSIQDEVCDGIARIRVGFRCKWDEEHGFAALIHGGKEIETGGGDLGL
jgi:hypothetical protein